jgi:nicotinate-nucleotide adenylyltransferase
VAVVRVGVLGGTFDPPHKGHLAVAHEARTRLELSCIIFVPAGQPWLKSEMSVSPAADRFEMVRLAISPYPYFKISSAEVDRLGPSYTVDTLAELKADLGSEDELFFLMGWDSLAQLPKWRQASEIIRLSCLVAVPRPGYPRPDIESMERDVPGIAGRVLFLEIPQIDVSATEIRRRVAEGKPIGDLVTPPVEQYVKAHGLYRS